LSIALSSHLPSSRFLHLLIPRYRYIASAAGINQADPNYEHWKSVFEHFLPKEEEQPLDADAVDRMLASASNAPMPPSAPEEKSLSKRRKKLMSRLRSASP
jgi:hypothetical protein